MLRGRATMSQCGTSVVPQLIDLLKLQPSMLQGTSAPPLLYEIQAKYAGCVGSGAVEPTVSHLQIQLQPELNLSQRNCPELPIKGSIGENLDQLQGMTFILFTTRQ